jgi:hypothetical protein
MVEQGSTKNKMIKDLICPNCKIPLVQKSYDLAICEKCGYWEELEFEFIT